MDLSRSLMDLLNSWIRNNNIVISWILNSVSKEISFSIIFSELASESWLDLQNKFQESNGSRVFQLRRDLIYLSQDQYLISVYFTKLGSLWEKKEQLSTSLHMGNCTCGGVGGINSHYQEEYILFSLSRRIHTITHLGLNDSYAQVLLIGPLPPINKVFSLVIREEQ